MVIVTLLVLNMLIAAMGESYGAVSEKGAAQFRFEQAQLIIEQRCLPSSNDKSTGIQKPSWIYIWRSTDSLETDEVQEHLLTENIRAVIKAEFDSLRAELFYKLKN